MIVLVDYERINSKSWTIQLYEVVNNTVMNGGVSYGNRPRDIL